MCCRALLAASARFSIDDCGLLILDLRHCVQSAIYRPKSEESDIKYRDLFRALVDIGAAGRAMCESPDQEVDALVMQKTYRRLASKKQDAGSK